MEGCSIFKHGSFYGIALLQSELRRVLTSSVTSVSYLGPLSTNIFEPRYKNVRNPSVQYSSAALQSGAAVFLYKRLGSQNNKRSTGMSSRGLLARARQLPAGPFLSTYTSTCSTSHILHPSTSQILSSTSHILNSSTSQISTSTAACYSISHTSPIPLSSPLEVEVEVPWGKIAGLQWSIPQTSSDQKQVEANSNRIDKSTIESGIRGSLCPGWTCTG